MLAHVDVGTLNGLDVVESKMRALVDGREETAGTAGLGVVRLVGRPNHFELIGRYQSQEAYFDHLTAPSHLALRGHVGPLLGAPYEDRVHAYRGQWSWPHAELGDIVVITQVETRPRCVDAALPVWDAIADDRRAAEGAKGQVSLQRWNLPNNLEIVSVWSSLEAFDAYVSTPSAKAVVAKLEPLLLAPISDRRNELIASSWSAAR